MSIHAGDRSLLEGERPVAKMTALARESQKPSKGLLGKLKNLIKLSDRGFVNVCDAHLPAATAVLALLLLFDEVTDIPGGD
jgi:hypothetical protein